MLKRFFIGCFILMSSVFYAQNKSNKSLGRTKTPQVVAQPVLQIDSIKKATIDQYKITTLYKDTTYVDTSLTIQREYKFNYLRKDNFGLLPFSNEGQTYNTLQYSLNKFSAFPEFGFSAKKINYLAVDDIKYYNVATPMTELYFKTVMEQGQMVDAFITLNTSERLNFGIGYRGLRSLGKYVNQLSSNGNFRFLTSYNTKNKRYFLKAHFTGQDLSNGENGGIANLEDYEGDDENFNDRPRLDVYSIDAKSTMKGNRYFVDHYFRINKTDAVNNLFVTHQFNYENKFYEYVQPTIFTQIDDVSGSRVISRYGASYNTSNIKDKTRYNRMYNKMGVTYENKVFGEFQFFLEDFRYNYFYNQTIIGVNTSIKNLLSDDFKVVGAQYAYQKNNWNGRILYSNSISTQKMSNLDASLSYKVDSKNQFHFKYQNISKVPDHIFSLFQSSYIDYNWQNNFNNEKINAIEVVAETQWANASLNISSLKDHLYFKDSNDNYDVLTVTPNQYSKTINYVSLKVSKEIKFGKFALDNTFLYQKTDQEEAILNVPQFVTRNTLYYSDHLFKKALFLQTGITFSYFSKYYADNYNPVLGEFFIQNQKEIGGFPTFDFFINAKIRNTRIYLKAEHFNSSFTNANYYSAPNYPYRDFIVRFGLVWNFFS